MFLFKINWCFVCKPYCCYLEKHAYLIFVVIPKPYRKYTHKSVFITIEQPKLIRNIRV